jgi:hypothetical protein
MPQAGGVSQELTLPANFSIEESSGVDGAVFIDRRVFSTLAWRDAR